MQRARTLSSHVVALTLAVMWMSGCTSTTPGHPSNRVLPATSIVADVIPAPATAAARDGVFVIRASTQISVPPEAQTARIGSYLADLLQRTRGVRLEVVERAGSSEPRHAIVLRLDPHPHASNPESYEIDVTPERIALSAGAPRGLVY